MKIKSLVLSLLLLITLSACERKPDLAAPNKYEANGINFKYPGNWKITEDGENNDVHFLMVTSTGDEIFMIHTFNSQQAPKLEEFSETFSSSISSEMPFGEMKTESMTTMKKEGEDTWIKEAISVTLLKLNVPHTREYRKITSEKKTAFLSSQTSDVSQEKVKPGFNLIIESFSITE